MIRTFAALGALMLISGTGLARPATIYIMRHLQRDAGADPSLNATGQANAARLAGWFGRDKPKAIFVTPYKRTRETVAALAARLGVTPREYDPRDTAKLVEAVRAEKGSVLIVGHSNTVPAIAHALGGAEAPELADDDYGRIWIVKEGGKSVTVVPLSEPQPR
jgi:broad specificity phosphatase PhoE